MDDGVLRKNIATLASFFKNKLINASWWDYMTSLFTDEAFVEAYNKTATNINPTQYRSFRYFTKSVDAIEVLVIFQRGYGHNTSHPMTVGDYSYYHSLINTFHKNISFNLLGDIPGTLAKFVSGDYLHEAGVFIHYKEFISAVYAGQNSRIAGIDYQRHFNKFLNLVLHSKRKKPIKVAYFAEDATSEETQKDVELIMKYTGCKSCHIYQVDEGKDWEFDIEFLDDVLTEIYEQPVIY